ncbi:MAG: VWA domain-containing protein [Chthoniobacterales bacterium]
MTSLHDFALGAPSWLWALLIVPALVLVYVRAERSTAARLGTFISPKLLPELAGTVNYARRAMRFALLLVGLTCAILALAQPRWGYTYDETKRKGLDLLLAVDTSRSMLSNDVQPSRLDRVKLAAQDFINELQGDRIGLIAFAGRAFVQAPLTIDYNAAIDAVNDLDTNTIPEGGTNISEAINLAVSTYGKSATGNRALIIFTDGEELSGDATKTAKAAADAGVRIFTIGVGTPEGSLIPLRSPDGSGTAFVKDDKGQVVKSKLDEKRLRELAAATGGLYLHLDNGPSTMKQLVREGLSTLQAGQIDARLSRRPIERYQWPLAAGCIALASWFLVSERKRVRVRGVRPQVTRAALAAAAVVIASAGSVLAASPGLDAYRTEKYRDAYEQFQQTLKEHPQSEAADKLHFDSGAAAYKLKDYNKALDAFSQALLSPDKALQSRSHYNLGNTLYERGESQTADAKKLGEWANAVQHYEQALKLDPNDKEAKENLEFVKNKIEELKRKQEQPTPSPSPQQQQQQKQQDKNQQKNDQQSPQKKDQQQQQRDQNQQQQDQQSKDDQQKQEQSKDEQKKDGQQKDQPNDKQGTSPTPSPSAGEKNQDDSNGGPSPSPSASASTTPGQQPQPENGDNQNQPASPTPAQEQNKGAGESPSPSPGEGNGAEANGSATAAPSASPAKKLAGELKGTNDEKSQEQAAEIAEAEEQKDGQMSEKQAELLLKSMKDEEQRVQLDERKAARHVYKDW